MASTRFSACDMETSFSPREVDSVCLVSVILAQELWWFPWVSHPVRIHGNATAAADHREQDLKSVQGQGKLSVPTQGKGQPMMYFNRST